MSILDGAAAGALKDFGSDFADGVLLVPGPRSSDGQGGFTNAEPYEYDCKVLVTDYSDTRRLALGVPGTDRQILVLGASVSVVPAKGNTVRAPDPAKGGDLTDFLVVAKSGDPAGAVYRLQATG